MYKIPEGYSIYEVEVKRVEYATIPVIAKNEFEAVRLIADNGVDSSYLIGNSDYEWRGWEPTGDDRVWYADGEYEP